MRSLTRNTRWLSSRRALFIVALVSLAVLMASPELKLTRPAKAVFATNRFVANGGSDTTNCSTAGMPCATINYAIGQSIAGDTIIVSAGTYTENVVLNQSLNLKGAQAGVDARGRVATETIVMPASAARALELVAGSAMSTIDGFTFSGGTFVGTSGLIESTSGPLNNLQILNNRFVSFPGRAVNLNDPGTDITVNQNSINGASNTAATSGIFHLDTDLFNGFQFTNNWVLNAPFTEGFFVDGNHNVGPSGTRNPLISGNLFDKNNVGANLGTRAFGSFTVPNAGTISNNTFSNNTFDGLQGGIQNTLITGNTFSNNGRHGLSLTSFGNAGLDRGGQNTTVKGNLMIGNGFAASPTGPGAGLFFSSTQAAGTIQTNHANLNRIVGNNVGAQYGSSVSVTGGAATIDVENNWWGCNYGPGTGGIDCMGMVNGTLVFAGNSGVLDADPWLVLKITAVPSTIVVGGNSALTADLTFNSNNVDTSASGNIPNGTPVAFAGMLGTVAPTNTSTTSGKANSTFTGTTAGMGSASTTVDGQTVSTPITILSASANKVDTPDPVMAGNPLTYTITALNPGPSNALNFRIVDPLPTGTVFISAVASPGATLTTPTPGANGTVTAQWDGAGGTPGGLTFAGVTRTLTIVVRVCPDFQQTLGLTDAQMCMPNLTNTATITSDTPGTTTTASSVSTVQAQSDLSVSKTGSPNPALAGQDVTYTLNFSNAGPSNANGVVVTDTLPAGFTLVGTPTSTVPGTTFGSSTMSGVTTVTANLGVLGAANQCSLTRPSSGTITIVAHVPDNHPSTTVVNNAAISTTNCLADLTPGNNTGTFNTMVIAKPPLVVTITDPLGCTGPGDVLTVTANLTNPNSTSQTASFTATLPAGLIALPGTCSTTVNPGGCVITSSVTWSGTLAAGQTVTITYQVQVADGTPPNTQLCINSTGTVAGNFTTVQACTTVNCPTVGPGTPPPAAVAVSDQKPGSVLFYNLYTSNPANLTAQNTRINITNTDPSRSVAVHLFFVDGASCTPADTFICLTPNQTMSFLASDIDPGTTGYIVAVAADPITGCPINFNFLIGDEFVKLASGHQANLAAESFAALTSTPPVCAAGALTATLNFDGVSYNQVPRVLAVDNFPSPADGNNTLVILNRVGGNLLSGTSTIGSLFGFLFDESEQAFSFSLVSNTCQFRFPLTNSGLRILQRLETVVGPGRTGWLRLWGVNDIGLLGSVINLNATAGVNNFNQGHNLHKLTFTNASLTIPIFPPNCQ